MSTRSSQDAQLCKASGSYLTRSLRPVEHAFEVRDVDDDDDDDNS